MSKYKLTESFENKDLLTSVQNLCSIDKRQKTLFRSRQALIQELAYTICNGGLATIEEIKENYRAVFPVDSPRSNSETGKYFDTISIAEKIEICQKVASLVDGRDTFYESILGNPDTINSNSIKKIAYVKNQFTDSAYLSFSGDSSDFQRVHFDSFDSACQDVHSGESEFCILPVETSHDGKLIPFYSMIDRYELKIVATCTVGHQEDSKFTKFALLGRSISLDQAGAKRRKLELRISQSLAKSSTIYEILLAAYNCNIQLCRIDSLPLSYNESMLSYYAVFDIDDSDLKAFITYLAIEHPQCYALGIYFEN